MNDKIEKCCRLYTAMTGNTKALEFRMVADKWSAQFIGGPFYSDGPDPLAALTALETVLTDEMCRRIDAVKRYLA